MSYQAPLSPYPEQQGYLPQQGYPPQSYAPQQGYPPQQGYVPQPQYAAQPSPQVIIIRQGGTQLVEWQSDWTDCCAAPGGLPLFCYVTLCTPCAAGDVAVAADRSYLCACCIAPTLSHLLHHYGGDIIENCAWVRDRHYLTAKFHVRDPLAEPVCFQSQAFCLFQLGCSHCLLIQELNHIKAVEMGLKPGPNGLIVPKQMVM